MGTHRFTPRHSRTDLVTPGDGYILMHRHSQTHTGTLRNTPPDSHVPPDTPTYKPPGIYTHIQTHTPIMQSPLDEHSHNSKPALHSLALTQDLGPYTVGPRCLTFPSCSYICFRKQPAEMARAQFPPDRDAILHLPIFPCVQEGCNPRPTFGWW